MASTNAAQLKQARNRQTPVATFVDGGGTYRALATPAEMAGSNEVWELIFNKGIVVKNHYHKIGYEVFYLTQGAMKVVIAGQTYTMKPGDLVSIPPYMPHEFTFLEQDSTLITFFRDVDFYGTLVDEKLVRETTPELYEDEAFMADLAQRHDSYPLVPCTGNLTSKINPPLAPGESLASYNDTYHLKVPVWDMGGDCELWEMDLAEGAVVHHQLHRGAWEAFYVLDGSVDVVLGSERFVARPGDLLLVPPYVPHQFTFLENTKWLAFFRNLNYFQALEMRHSPSAEDETVTESESWRTQLGVFYEMVELPVVE